MEVLANLGHGYCGEIGLLRVGQCVQVRVQLAVCPLGSTLALAMQTVRRLLGDRTKLSDFMLPSYHLGEQINICMTSQ